MIALSITRTRPHSWRGCEPPTPNERLAAFRAELHQRADFEPMSHAAQIARGVAWQHEFRRRPIPRHRALIPLSYINTPAQAGKEIR